MPSIKIKRGTRSQIDAAATANQLKEGEMYLITDEDRLGVGKSASTYISFPKMSELGGSSGGNTGTATIDFGSGSNEAQVTVLGQTGISSTSTVSLSVSADATSTAHTASDHRYFLELCSLTSGTPVANTGFTIYARSVHKLTGTWTIKWSWN